MSAEEKEAQDPVCGMSFDKDEAAATMEYEGEVYYFCGESCKEEFAANPDQYAHTR
jgi:Cu+-exporting ATPase